MKKALSLALLLLLGLILPGCYDYSEPDERAWVLAMGLDKGRQNVLTVTVVIAVPKNIVGGSGGEPTGGGGFYTVSLEAPTLLSSLELLNAMVDRRADLSHTKWFVFSRELAEESIAPYFGPITRFYQFRRSSHVVICEGRAEDFLAKGTPKLEDNVGKYYELLQRGWRNTEFIPFDTFHEFYIKSKEPGVASVALLASLDRETSVFPDNSFKPKGNYQAGRIPREGGDKIEVMGGAVFKEGRMIDTLDGDEVGMQKLFEGTLSFSIMDVLDPKEPDRFLIIEVRPRQKPKIDVRIVDGYPQITADVKLEGEILSIQSGYNYEKPDNLPVLEEAVEKHVREDLEKTIAKSQKLGADFLGFGLHAKKLFWTWSQWEAYKWDEKYAGANIAVNVDFKIRRIGLVRKMTPLE
ncbi:Ger(x)C family spore germination protein [Desulfoscipio sp. XC116]|uniref:Ger(x)C family spore germination protein n=1 Tax=Desulfoscipio sp. XC116 TaxID=3144975 RepID=UPI00325B824F